MLLRSLVIGLSLILSASSAHAQQALSGVVRDSSGAVVAGATVIVRQPGQAFERIVISGRDGRFTVSPVAAGTYTVEAVAAGFAPAQAAATVPATATVELTLTPAAVVEEVQIVSASRQEELRQSLNTNVSVLSRRQIEESGAQTAAEMLREVPGVITRRGTESAGAAGQQIQGIDSRQVLVLLDGQPLAGARGIKRGVVNLDRQSTGRLEQIEVVKGAASALYGSDAIGGVINLITREASSPMETTGELSAGNLGERNAIAGVGVRRDRWSGLLSVERHEHDGFDLTPTTFDTTGAPFERVDLLARIRFKPSDSVSLSGLATGYDNHTTGRSNGELGPQEDAIDDSTFNVNLQGDWLPRPGTSLQGRVYSARYDEDSTGRLATGVPLDPGALQERVLKTDVSFAHILGTRQQLQGGVEYWNDRYEGINRLRNDAGEEATIGTAWLQHRLSLGSRVTTTLGLRADAHSEFGSALSPKVAANAQIGGGVSVRASYGRGFRAPDIGQLYYRFLNPSSIYQVVGNPGLQPEYANSLQLGTEYATPGRRARFGFNVFRNDVRDLIESVSLGFAATPAQVDAIFAREGLDLSFRPVAGRLLLSYKNINDAVTAGAEVDGEIAVTRALSLAGAYTFLDARDDANDLRLTGRHKHHGHVRATWRHDVGFVANLRGQFYSNWIAARATVNGQPQDTIAPGFSVWDAYVSQRIVRAISIFAAVDNLADSQDPNLGLVSGGSPLSIYRFDAGRTARFGVRWSWSK